MQKFLRMTHQHAFDLDGGLLCLDFVNTLEQENGEDVETLREYADLVAFALQAGTITYSPQTTDLMLMASRHGAEAQNVLTAALELRGVIYRILSDSARGDTPASIDIAAFNDWLDKTLCSLRVAPEGNGFGWQWAENEPRLERVLWPIVWSLAQTLVDSEQLSRVKECSSHTCKYLFYDTSRNRSRRWCDMTTCGNRDKVRRFYRRQKDES